MISFIIRSKDEEAWIGHAIQSVIDNFGSSVEIIIVDNDSTDDTLEIVNLFAKRFHNIKILSIPKGEYTPGKSLNFGISKVSKDSTIIGILSSHCQIKNINIELIKKHLSDDKCSAVMGKQIPVFRGKKIRMRYIWGNFNVIEPVKNPIENIEVKRYFFHNAFSFIKKADVEKLPFDEDLSGKEDRYWAKKIIDSGKSFVLDPNLVCFHHWTDKGATWSGIG